MTDRPAFWWRLTAAYVVVLYATLPLGRPAITWLRAHFTTAQQICMTYVLAGMVAAAGIAWLARNWRRLSLWAGIGFAAVVLLYWYEFRTITTYPEERLHFLEYGVLAWILHTAFSFYCRAGWPYVCTMVVGFLVGWGDEGVQWLTKFIPTAAGWFGCTVGQGTFCRYYEFKDVMLNAKGVAYGLAFLALVVRNRR